MCSSEIWGALNFHYIFLFYEISSQKLLLMVNQMKSWIGARQSLLPFQYISNLEGHWGELCIIGINMMWSVKSHRKIVCDYITKTTFSITIQQQDQLIFNFFTSSGWMGMDIVHDTIWIKQIIQRCRIINKSNFKNVDYSLAMWHKPLIRTWETQAGGSLWIQRQLGLCVEKPWHQKK